MINALAHLNQIDLIPSELYEREEVLKKEIADLEYKIKIGKELLQEFVDDKEGFLRKYSKPKYKKQAETIIQFIKKERGWKEIAKRLDEKSKTR